jgi:pyruvate ferredoxin oxidoreductase alpha subunit
VCSEVRSALYPLDKKPKVVSFIGGLGGRDILPKNFEEMVDRGLKVAEKGEEGEYQMIGVRE